MGARSSHSTSGKWSPLSRPSSVVKNIRAMLHPRNIVLVSATDKPGNYAERISNNLILRRRQSISHQYQDRRCRRRPDCP
jgi:hypothetical protein